MLSVLVLLWCLTLHLNSSQAHYNMHPYTNYEGARQQQHHHERMQCFPSLPPVSPFALAAENVYANCYEEVSASREKHHPDEGKRSDEMIVKYGYNLTTYDNVITEDGYILTLFRVSGGPKSPPKQGKPAVLLFHGLATASDCWLLQPNDRNLAFKLADLGYEVWLGNARGTDYSSRHVLFHPNEPFPYWDFGFHEVGIYDIPAIVELMLAETGNESIFFIGHSMGSTFLAVALAELPELNQKIKVGIMLAPALFIGHSYNALRTLTPIVGTPLQDIIYYMLKGHFDWDRILGFLGVSETGLCTPSTLRCGLCDNWIFFLYGYDASQANYTNLPNILSKVMNIASLQAVVHLSQNMQSCQFRKYDYGIRGNYAKYGTFFPPSYNLKRITSPTYIFYAESDNFVPPADILMTKNAMRPDTVKGTYKVSWPLFNHADFVSANDADKYVYETIIDILESYR